MEIRNVPEIKYSVIANVLAEEAVDSINDFSFTKDDDNCKIGNILCSDQTTLCAGETEKEAHKRIMDAVKNVAP